VASGKIRLEFHPINLYDVVKVSFHAHKPAAEAKHIQLEFNSDSENIPVFGDPGRLQQVFGNLISNALKFTPEGGEVFVEMQKTEDAVRVTVRDSGRGISSESLPSIFKQFAQGDLDKEKSKIGLGLGLSIVKILVTKHGGNVVAESEGIGLGSTFTITLPLSNNGFHAATEAIHTSKDEKPIAGTRVLLVEDDNDSREVIQLFLEHNGALVTSCHSAEDALEKLEHSEGMLPDVILSDLAMPGLDGYMMIERIRELPEDQGGKVPAIALSAFGSDDTRNRAMECGFQIVTTKPFDPDILLPAIVKLTNLKK
jgi:CheY-like chemotaxis protein